MTIALPFDMPPQPASFETRGGWLVRQLVADLNLTPEQAGGIVGNLGFESGGLKILQEIRPVAGRGGRGWPQWTASRRVAFEIWCEHLNLDPDSDEANYGYLLVELRGAYKSTVAALKKTKTDADAVFSVGQTYERPGGTTATHLPGFDGRLRYARRALAGAAGANGDHIGDVNEMIRSAARALQTALQTGGFYAGKIDGDWGPKSEAAMQAFRAQKS